MSTDSELYITEDVRFDVLDSLWTMQAPVEGQVGLIAFLRRAWNLRELPSKDHRFENAERDIWQHMVNNSDWSKEELYIERLGILDCPDAQFLKFLEAVVNPVVRGSVAEQEQFADVINRALERTNWKLFPSRDDPRKYVAGLAKLTFMAEKVWIGDDQEEEKDQQSRTEEPSDKFEVVLSFAGEDRVYVEEVAAILQQEGVSLFYDRYQKATLWGKDLTEHLARVYGGDARYCVMFISKAYGDKVWTTHERRNAFAEAMQRREEYVLPARFDDTKIEGLRHTIGYIDLRHETPKSFAEVLLEKLGRR